MPRSELTSLDVTQLNSCPFLLCCVVLMQLDGFKVRDKAIQADRNKDILHVRYDDDDNDDDPSTS